VRAGQLLPLFRLQLQRLQVLVYQKFGVASCLAALKEHKLQQEELLLLLKRRPGWNQGPHRRTAAATAGKARGSQQLF
jgi:hypothetical protein